MEMMTWMLYLGILLFLIWFFYSIARDMSGEEELF